MSRWFALSACIMLVLILMSLPSSHAPTLERSNAPTLERSSHARQQQNGPWLQVNDSAFGLPGGGPTDQPYANEQAFEVLVANDQLYLGMEANNDLGARLWRSRAGVTLPTSQADWQEVAADNAGAPFGNDQRQQGALQNDHIDSLALFQDQIYVSTANGGSSRQGTLIYRSPSGDRLSWTQVITAGFGAPDNTNFKDMTVFAGQLCGGTLNTVSGAQLWCSTDGTTWQQYNISGFGDGLNQGIWSLHSFNGALYAGVNHARANGAKAKLFRTTSLDDPAAWEEVFDGPAGSVVAMIAGDLDGYLYMATQTINGIAIWRSASGDVDSWVRVSSTGMDQNPANVGSVTDGGVMYADTLVIAVINETTGLELWQTSGILAMMVSASIGLCLNRVVWVMPITMQHN
ncbi:MAG: hypothetical protein HC837_15010 [Chloroflexaceae bacterium]|nr:hypothetical protein [Chloroflexaceae bacterium]